MVKRCFFLILLLFFCPQAFAEQIQARTIAIKPYGFQQGFQLQGVYYELLRAVLDEQGYRVNHGIYPYARIAHGLETGSVDITIMFQYKNLMPYVTYIAPLPPLQNVVLSTKKNSIQSRDELVGKSLAYLRGAKFSSFIDNNSEIEKVIITDFAQGMKMLKANRVDGIVGPLMPLLMLADEFDLPRSDLSKPIIVSTRTPWLQVSNKSVAKFNTEKLKESFEKMLTSPVFSHIQDKYNYTLQPDLTKTHN